MLGWVKELLALSDRLVVLLQIRWALERALDDRLLDEERHQVMVPLLELTR